MYIILWHMCAVCKVSTVKSQSINPETGRKTVSAILEDGRRFEGDVLIGADGIWSKVTP